MIKQFLNDENGQTTTEYILILAVIVVIIGVLGKGMRTQLEQTINTVFGGINNKINQLMQAGMGQQ